MIKSHKKVSFFKVNEYWFSYKSRFQDIFSLSVLQHLKDSDNKFFFGVQRISHTLELDLEQDVETIFAGFAKQIRQQAKIAENEGTICYFNTEVARFADFYNEFAQKRETFTTSEEQLAELGDSVKLSFAENNGQILAAHSYLVDKEMSIVRHLHSASKRLDENFDRNLIGRANKYLTVKDILYFKEMGYKTFDFGGYKKDPQDDTLKGINNYKLLFGGKVVPCINYYSYSYWLLKRAAKLLGVAGKL